MATTLEQLKSQLSGWEGTLIHVEGNEHGWQGLLASCCEALDAQSQLEVVLVIEDERTDVAGAPARNLIRDAIRCGIDESSAINVYSSLDEAFSNVSEDLEL